MAAQVNNPHTLTGSSHYQPGQTAGQAGQTNQATKDEMRHALNRVLNSKHFVHAPMKQKFLRLTCDFHLNGRGAELNEYLIGREVFARDDSYNPATDPIVRVGAHGVREKLALYYQREGAEDEVRIEIPIGSYEPAFVRSGQEPKVEAAAILGAAGEIGRQFIGTAGEAVGADEGQSPRALGALVKRGVGKERLVMGIALVALSVTVIALLVI